MSRVIFYKFIAVSVWGFPGESNYANFVPRISIVRGLAVFAAVPAQTPN